MRKQFFTYKIILTPILLLCFASVSHAEEEKILNVYNWSDYIGLDTIANFEKEFGIKVNYDIYDTSEMVDAKLMAGRTGYDFIFHAASFSTRLSDVGLFKPLDKSKLTNLKHMDEGVMQIMADFGLGDSFSVPYMWGTTGIAYNIDMLKERMPGVPLESSDFFFKPEIMSRFADCGISVLDSSLDVLPMALSYLGYHTNSIDTTQLKEAEQLMKSIRPYIKYFSSAKMLIDMPNKEICVSMSWSGDYAVARARAKEAGIDINLGFSMPEGAIPYWMDVMFIPIDAPHPHNAHLFMNYLMRPEVIAPISDLTGYANANKSATALVNSEITNDPAIYPGEDVRRRLQPALVYPPKKERPRSRAYTRIKTGL